MPVVRFGDESRLRRPDHFDRPLRHDRGAAVLQVDFDVQFSPIDDGGDLLEQIGRGLCSLCDRRTGSEHQDQHGIGGSAVHEPR